jgi:hypothetical protein
MTVVPSGNVDEEFLHGPIAPVRRQPANVPGGIVLLKGLNATEEAQCGRCSGAGAVGVLEFGKGVIVFMGDVNTRQAVPQALTRNI